MVEYNAELMSDKDLIEAANEVFSAQEKDFEKIKTEKWYQTFFHAITLNQDGKKYAVRGITSLAKLQQLFMNVYVRNYRKSHEQLDDVIDTVTQNSVAIKKLYGKCVLCLEEQHSLEQLDDSDAGILALFLGEYKDENGLVPKLVQDYNRGVLLALNQKVPSGTLDNHQLSWLDTPKAKVVYRCFMEQCAVDGTIDSQEWCDKIYEDLNDFELSVNSKSQIKEDVKREVETAGVEYLLEKYSRNNGISDSDFIIQLEEHAQNNSQEKKQTSQAEKGIDAHSLYMTAFEFDHFFSLASYDAMQAWNLGLLDSMVTIQSLGDELANDNDFNNISNSFLHESVQNSVAQENGFVFGYKICEMDDSGVEHSYFFLIMTVDGFFLFGDEVTVFIPIDGVSSVNENESGLEICSSNGECFDKSGNKVSGANTVNVSRTSVNKYCIRAFRKGLECFIKAFGGYISPVEYEIERIIGSYIEGIRGANDAYMAKDFRTNDAYRTKLKNALAKYAVNVREKDVIAFIDTSLRRNGKAGFIFTKEGMSFDYPFTKVFVYYAEIEKMTYNSKDQSLTLQGPFSEVYIDDNKLVNQFVECHDDRFLLPGVSYRREAWIKMIQEIQYVI